MLSRLKFVPMRLLQAVPVAFGVTLVVFFLAHLIPGDPAEALLGAQATPERVLALRQQLGLNDPLLQQYWTSWSGCCTVTWGRASSIRRLCSSSCWIACRRR